MLCNHVAAPLKVAAVDDDLDEVSAHRAPSLTIIDKLLFFNLSTEQGGPRVLLGCIRPRFRHHGAQGFGKPVKL